VTSVLSPAKPPATASDPGRGLHDRRLYKDSRAFGRFGMRIFAPQAMAAPHWHGHVEMNLLTGARMVYDLDGTRVEVPENRLAVFWAAVPHALTAIEPVGAEPPLLANIYIPADAFLMMPNIGRLQVGLLGGALALLDARLCDLDRVRLWYADYRRNDFERREVVKMEINAMFRRALLDEIEYLRPPLAGAAAERVASSANAAKVVEMVRFILDHLREPIGNGDVAAAVGLHRNYALQLFTNAMRVSMKQFVIRMRLLQARAALVESEMPITAIVAESGFASVSQFYAHFRQAYGMSPKALRDSYLGQKAG